MHTTCVQEKSNRATGPHIDTCVCHVAGSRHAGRPGYLNSGDRLGKPDDEQGARAVFVLSALANSLGKSVIMLSALGDSVEKEQHLAGAPVGENFPQRGTPAVLQESPP